MGAPTITNIPCASFFDPRITFEVPLVCWYTPDARVRMKSAHARSLDHVATVAKTTVQTHLFILNSRTFIIPVSRKRGLF